MKFTLSCLTLLSVVYAAAFPPAADRVVSAEVYMGGNHTSDHINKRTPGNVRLCTAVGFSGYCVTITGGTDGGCIDLAFDLDNLVSSFGPDPNQSCMVFNAHGCADSGPTPRWAGPIVFPGVRDLTQPFLSPNGHQNAAFNDLISSYSCTFF
ncbi:hypothetical protein DFH08DRAFT_953071 [Mycena albidolilacea]|uniref:Uncharacterized protein n=1 Tax=Mycena albidolilacea TaxID=1033008 RepID=A0AAD7EZM9_9AGAR|nr:hypothetical protein DFH08DRAFT_953070 [Mycena albidolilacea]KAJ7359985.1 hypothetical protein DFH08DRAFT_953071 [Mycena albidolilacea]